MQYVGYILSILGFVGLIWVLIDAFKKSVAQGLLTLCVPCYIWYFLFAVSDNPQKMIQVGLIVLWFVGGGITGYSQQAALQAH
jgi:hypothetical protein